MQPSSAFLLALLAFINLIAAMVIPKADNGVPGAIAAVVGQTTTNHQQKFPFNTTDWELSPPFVVLAAAASSSSSNTEGEKSISPPFSHPSSQLPTKREEKVPKKTQVKPPPCPYPETRPCITQKEVDQGWHDRPGCYNRNLFLLGFGRTHCWDAGDDCVKEDCRY
ncbi:hypothetical protein MFRU_061g00410 [Monilinia fructicola]|nr:hypothetical protein MFRU_061g00410 [Monilinia fructicola]